MNFAYDKIKFSHDTTQMVDTYLMELVYMLRSSSSSPGNCNLIKFAFKGRFALLFPLFLTIQRTSGPVNSHLMYWPSKVKNIQNLEIYEKEMTLTFNTYIPS